LTAPASLLASLLPPGRKTGLGQGPAGHGGAPVGRGGALVASVGQGVCPALAGVKAGW
jgi:hypothetical protein